MIEIFSVLGFLHFHYELRGIDVWDDSLQKE